MCCRQSAASLRDAAPAGWRARNVSDEKRKARCFLRERGIRHSRQGCGTVPAHGNSLPGGNRACERNSFADQTNGVCRFRGYDAAYAQMREPDLRHGRLAGGQHRQLPHCVRQGRPREPREHQFSGSGRFSGKAGGAGGQPREIAGRHDRKNHCVHERELLVRRANYGRTISCRVAGAVQSETAVYCPDRCSPAPRYHFASPERHRHTEPIFPVLCRKPADCSL